MNLQQLCSFPDDDPLIFYKAVAAFGREKLNKGGSIYAEIHENLGEPIKGLFLSKGYQYGSTKKRSAGKRQDDQGHQLIREYSVL